MRSRRTSFAAALVGGLGVVYGCSAPTTHVYPKRELSEAEFIGAWSADYDGRVFFDDREHRAVRRAGREVLVLGGEGRFTQWFEEARGVRIGESKGAWHLDATGGGHPRLLLAGAREFRRGLEAAVASSPDLVRLDIESSSGCGGDARNTLMLCYPEDDERLCFGRD